MTLEMDPQGDLARFHFWQRQREGAAQARVVFEIMAQVPESALSNLPDLIAEICVRHGVTLEQMRAHRGRPPGAIHAAQELAWELYHNGRRNGRPLPFPLICDIVRRDRTTVKRAIAVHEQQRRVAAPFYRAAEDET